MLTNRFAMVALGYLAEDLMGNATQIYGAACTPGTGMAVALAAGRIYAPGQPLEATAWSSLNADTTDLVVKQGIALQVTSLACAAPTTAGQSIAYLIEGQYQDSDIDPAALSYYDADNPDNPFSGANNNGDAQPTVRAGIFAMQAIAGTAATTGTQTAPAATAGWTPMYVVTVPYGATSILSGYIATASGAPINTGSGFATQAYVGAAVASEASTRSSQITAEATARTTAIAAALASAETYANGTSGTGFEVLPSGKIRMWGKFAGQPTSPATITFPNGGFPGSCDSIVLTAIGAASTYYTSDPAASKTQFTLNFGASNTPFSWEAMGE